MAGTLHVLHNNSTYELFIYFMLCAAFCLFGIVLGSEIDETTTASSASTQKGVLQNKKASGSSFAKPKENHQRLHPTIDELTLLHTSDDLYERYQCFIRLTEDSLQDVLGPCDITLWCLDHNPEYLIECLIPSTGSANASITRYTHRHHRPYRIKLDCPVIRHALSTKQPCMISSLQKVSELHHCPKDQLLSDACIPLYRDYGQPVIASIKRTRPYTALDKNENFYQACKLIRLFWEQLQIANQRQWQSEHDMNDNVLHEQAFIEHAQNYAAKAARQDELFCLVVITLQGFRSMFAGQSQQWRRLSSLISQSLHGCLDKAHQDFFLGKMADDVFAILLHRTDQFLAKALMDKVLEQVDREIGSSRELQTLDVHELTVKWTLADHQKYRQSITDMLDNIYGGLFPPGVDQPLHEYHIKMPSAQQEVEASCVLP